MCVLGLICQIWAGEGVKWRWEQFVGFGLVGFVMGGLICQEVMWWLQN